MLITKSNRLQHLLAVPRVYGVGVGKQQHQINLIVRNAGIHLLMSPLLVGQQQGNRQARGLRHQAAGCCRSI